MTTNLQSGKTVNGQRSTKRKNENIEHSAKKQKIQDGPDAAENQNIQTSCEISTSNKKIMQSTENVSNERPKVHPMSCGKKLRKGQKEKQQYQVISFVLKNTIFCLY